MALSKEIGIDLGTANILIYVKGEGIVVNEPSVVAIDDETKKPLAVGQEAKDMLGKTPGRVKAIRPLKDGVIADFRITEILITHFINKLNLKGIFSRPTILICCPSNITSIEKSAIKDVAERCGAKRVFAYATHAVFSGAAAQHLASDAIDEIVVTDTVPLSPEMKALGKVRVLTLSTMLAEAIRRISNEESISAMFE